MKIVISILIFGILAQALGSPLAAAATPPNIILVLADDLGYGDVGVYGATLIETPHLDRLADEGVRFTNFYASANVCSPSRAGIMTGRYAIRDGLANKTIAATDQRGLPDRVTTVASMLKDNGYRTGLIGKWHLGHHSPGQRPNAHGFDFFYGLLQPNDDAGLNIYRNTEPADEPVDQSALTRRFTREAVAFVERNSGVPFFLYMSHSAPHIPLVPSPAFANTSRAGAYGDVVQELDWSVGRLLDAVRSNGLADNTVIIFTSDNGPFPEGSAGGLRGGKGTGWDGGYRVPFIARWPGHIVSGSTITAMAMNIDVLPTFAAIAGLSLASPQQLDGRNILPLLTGGPDQSPHEVLYFFNNERIAALRTQRWRLVLSDYPPWRDAKPILFESAKNRSILMFDMQSDPREQYDMSREHADARQQLLAHLARGRETLEARSTLNDDEMYEGAIDKN